MSIKCKYCGRTDLLPTYKRCPTCGNWLSVDFPKPSIPISHLRQTTDKSLKFTDMSKSHFSHQAPDLEMVKNCVVWSLVKGEVARRIGVGEFEKLSGAKGVYVQDGVTAVLMADGKILTALSSGVYYFPTAVERFTGALRNIWLFFAGKKQNGSQNEYEPQGGRLGSVLQNLGKNPHVDVVLAIDGIIPIVLGMRQMDFYPYTVQTRRSSLQVGVTMNLAISDLNLFRKNYLTDKNYCRVWDLQNKILDPVGNVLQKMLEHEDIEAATLPPVLEARVREAIINKVNTVLYGVTVTRVIDISINSDDFERFHDLEHKIYNTEKELEYLIRTNAFKNRLIAENNSQKLKEARSEEDIRYALNLLNKDRLLHDDEMEAFCQLLASQKKIREAQTDADTDKALLEIKGNRLVSEDDYEELVHELKKKKDARQEVESILHYQSVRRVETERMNAEKDLGILAARNEGELEQAQYETASQELLHQHILEKSQALHHVEMNDVARGERKKDDDYANNLREKVHKQDMAEARDDMNLYDEQERLEIQRDNLARQNALDALAQLEEMKRAGKSQDYEHEEVMAKIRTASQKELQQIIAGMSADKIAATHLTELSPEAQVAMAAAFSSTKELEWRKKSEEERFSIIMSLVEKSSRIDKESREQQERTIDKILQFMANEMKANVSVVTGAVDGQRATAKAQMDTIRDVATNRINEVTADKQEYREEAHHSQSRLDKTQESSLNYTTMTSEAKLQTDRVKAMSGAAQETTYYMIPEFGERRFDYSTVITMIKDEAISPDTEIIIGTESYTAYDLKEFRKILDKMYSVKCPHCGRKGLKGHLCEECQTQL